MSGNLCYEEKANNIRDRLMGTEDDNDLVKEGLIGLAAIVDDIEGRLKAMEEKQAISQHVKGSVTD